MSRPYAADDADAISRRLAELDAERRAAIGGCLCTEVTDSFGHKARSWSAACPVHAMGSAELTFTGGSSHTYVCKVSAAGVWTIVAEPPPTSLSDDVTAPLPEPVRLALRGELGRR